MSLRVLLVVTHLLGAGHLTRMAAIGRALARRGHRVTLVSGGTPTPLVPMDGLDLVQLLPVRAAVGNLTRLLDEDGRPADAARLSERTRVLLDAYQAAGPDVLVTELFPFGRRVLAPEFEALLAEAGAASVPVLASVRDVLATPHKASRAERTAALVHRHYRAVLVHGDEGVLPLDRSWPVDDALRPFLRYTGYVGPDDASSRAAGRSGTVLVSGGSSEGALPLYRTALLAAERDRTRPWHILVGRAVGSEPMAALQRMATPNVVVERARTDFRERLADCAVFVGQAGYNTAMDIVSTRARAVLVPFEEGGETEQRLRAECFAARGLASVLVEAELSPDALLAAVALRGREPPLPANALRLDGAARSAEIIETVVAEGRA